MKHSVFVSLAILGLSLSGCSDQAENMTESFDSVDEAAGFASEPALSVVAGDADAAATDSDSNIPVSIPQIAYSYQYGFRIEASKMASAQRTHADLCEKQGPKVCHVLNMEQSGVEGDYATGRLQIEVAAPQARAFGSKLTNSVTEDGGTQISSAIKGEDLTKRIVDTEARLRTRKLLAERLTELLRTRKGTVKELVEAERGVAQVNEEIDQAASWLADMKGRVAFSKMTIEYQSGKRSSGGFFRPIREAFNDISSTLGSTVAFLITFLAAIVPWLMIFGAIVWALRKLKWWPFRKRHDPFQSDESETETDK